MCLNWCQERPHQPTYCIWAVPLMGLSWLFDDHEISFKREIDIFLLLVCLHAMNTGRFYLAWISTFLVARARALTADGFPSSLRGSHNPCVCCSLGMKSWWLEVDISRLLPLYLNPWKLISSLGYPPDILLRWLHCLVLLRGPRRVPWETYQMVW